MPERLHDIVEFRGDRLFNGAVNIGWFGSDDVRTRAAAEAFVFHGPAYHGVSQDDIGVAHGHRLQDSASFARAVVRRCYGIEDQPFTLAIAGYGTGKSHLGLTLASLLQSPSGGIADVVMSGVDCADQAIGAEIRAILREARRPCLVVALNGMQSFDLTTEVSRQILQQVKAAGMDTRPLDELRPRFAQATSLIQMAVTNTDVVSELLAACEVATIAEVLANLKRQDEVTYGKVHQVLAAKNIKIAALGGESVHDVIDVACREYCGPGKAFRCLVVLFDEFGRYTEFATVRSHIAGSGVLQDLFEGVQANAGKACFVGFIQFELAAYLQRLAPDLKKDVMRYVERYNVASDRIALSINLETLIASLIEKKQRNLLDSRFDNATARQESADVAVNLKRWFPESRHHRLWSDSEQFHGVIRKGCWPLSAYSTWFLFRLAAAGKHLQQRSALSLLGDAFRSFKNIEVDTAGDWTLAPVDFWTDALQQEFINSEAEGQQGSVAHAYATVDARHGAKLNDTLRALLRAIVLAAKAGLQSANRDDAVECLSEVAGLHLALADKGLQTLQDDNFVGWDDAHKEFDILGDAVPRTQFLAFVRHRVASTYDGAGRAALFASKASKWCDLFGDLEECCFAEDNKITTREWRYAGVTASLDLLAMQVKLAADRWVKALAVDEPRGTIIYCYVEPDRVADVIVADAGKLLRAAAKTFGVAALPILVVILYDEEGALGQALAELAVLNESVSEEDRLRFGNLIPAHMEKTRQAVRNHVGSMIMKRLYGTCFKDGLEARTRASAGTELFAKIYKSALTFPFDGFGTSGGTSGPLDCQALTLELLLGRLDYDAVLGKPVRVKNRAVLVLKNSWGIYAQNGDVRTRPSQPTVRALTERWDGLLNEGEQRINLGAALRELCAPPYGANVASAGLFLGVFVAARAEKLGIVRDNQQFAILQWVQDGLFRGKFLDFAALNGVYLVRLGETPPEWDALLDEWEQADSHLARRACLERAVELKGRVPVPPALGYRVSYLEQQSHTSLKALADMEQQQNDALSKVESGLRNSDVGLLSWGAAVISDLMARMSQEAPLWSEHQVQELQPSFERTRQTIIQVFSDWLGRQAPRDGTLDAAGDFKHRMLRLTGGNLKKLGLDDLCEQLEKRTHEVINKIETAAEARQVIMEVDLWLTTHTDATRFVRIAELRALHQVGKEYAAKLKGLNFRVPMPEIGEVHGRLSDMLNVMKDAEADIVKRASGLWKSKLRSVSDLKRLAAEVDELTGAFGGCQSDLEDLQLMRSALKLYQRDYQQLDDEHLSWPEFDEIVGTLQAEAARTLGEEELPWPPDEVVQGFVDTIGKQRTEGSLAWIEGLETDRSSIASLSVADANRLRDRVLHPPAVFAEKHQKRLDAVRSAVEKRLNELEVDWLVAKFDQLAPALRTAFLKRIAEKA